MALNLNKAGDENNNSLPKPENKGFNLKKEENKPVSKLNLSKDNIESEKNNAIPEEKNLNHSKEENKPASKLNLSKDNIEPTKKIAGTEKKESNLNTATSIYIEDKPKKKSKTLLYSLLGLVVIALAVFFISNNKNKLKEQPTFTETSLSEAPKAISAVTETTTVEKPVAKTPTVETPEVTETPTVANPVSETLKVETSTAQFAAGTSVFMSSNTQQVKSIKDYLAKNANNKVILIGYASSEGEINFNKLLSKKRAQSMKDYLTSNGVDGTRITTNGNGIENPIGDNSNEEGRKQNRRVEIIFK